MTMCINQLQMVYAYESVGNFKHRGKCLLNFAPKKKKKMPAKLYVDYFFSCLLLKMKKESQTENSPLNKELLFFIQKLNKRNLQKELELILK